MRKHWSWKFLVSPLYHQICLCPSMGGNGESTCVKEKGVRGKIYEKERSKHRVETMLKG